MKDIIAIGDIHGRDTWKVIVEANPDSKVIFIADYFDTEGETTLANKFDALLSEAKKKV